MGVPVRFDQRDHWRVGGPDLTDRQHLLHERPPGAHLPASGTFASRGAGARSRRLARGQGLAGAGEHHASALAAVFAGTQCRGKAVGIPQATLLEQPHLPRLPGAIHPDHGGLESPSPGSSSLFVFHRLGRAHDLKEKRITWYYRQTWMPSAQTSIATYGANGRRPAKFFLDGRRKKKPSIAGSATEGFSFPNSGKSTLPTAQTRAYRPPVPTALAVPVISITGCIGHSTFCTATPIAASGFSGT